MYQTIDRVILETIFKKGTAKDIWDSLKKKYHGPIEFKKDQLQALHKEFEILHMKVGEFVYEYFERTLTISNRTGTNGKKTENTIIIDNILYFITSKFDYVVY